MNYHAHIYWVNEIEMIKALSFRLVLHDNGCGLGRIKKKAIGPHPLPMYQVLYDEKNKEFTEGYLASASAGLSILLHENIGDDDYRDHTEGARWIGPRLELKLDFFQT